jgi:hypothetical protein
MTSIILDKDNSVYTFFKRTIQAWEDPDPGGDVYVYWV